MDRTQIARDVKERRLARHWSVEEAARRAGVNRVTWKRVEDGLTVQDAKLHTVLETVDATATEPIDSDLAQSAGEDLSDQLEPRLAGFTDFELVREVQTRMLLMAARLHAAGDDALVFVVDHESGDTVLTSRPRLGGS